MSDSPKLGYIGMGLMGRPMTLRLLAAGYKVSVWNRSKDKLASVTAKGAIAKESPAEVARYADIVMMCLTDQNSVKEVLFGKDGVAEAVVDGSARGKIVIDFSSIAPKSAREYAARLDALGMGYIDAPVSGGTPGAEQGTLAIMAGGKAEHIEFVRPLVAELSSRFTRMGDSGTGQVTKLANQIIVGSLLPVIAEAMRLAEAGGVDAARRAGKPPVGQQRDLLTHALPVDQCGDAEHFPHAGSTLRPFVADHQHVTLGIGARRDHRGTILLAVEHPRASRELQALQAGHLDQRAVGCEVALEHHQAAGGKDRFLSHDLSVRARMIGEFLLQGGTENRQAVAVQRTAFEQHPQHVVDAANRVQILGEEPSTRLHVGDQRRAFRNSRQIVE